MASLKGAAHNNKGASADRFEHGSLRWSLARPIIRCKCDNAVAVAILSTGMSRYDNAMKLMQTLFLTAKHNLILMAHSTLLWLIFSLQLTKIKLSYRL